MTVLTATPAASRIATDHRVVRLAAAALVVLGTMLGAAGSGRGTAQAQTRLTAGSITVTDDRGTTLTLPAPAHRLISLAPNITEILYSLGLGREVLADSSYSNYPKAALKLPIVINYTAVKYERIVRLHPDLIVAAAIVPQAAIDELRKLHLRVFVADPHDLAGILNDLRTIGRATGVATSSAAFAARLQARVDHVAAVMQRATTRPRVFYELDSTLYTVGHGSFVDSLIMLAGGTNVAGTIANPYPQISQERLIHFNPQYIILGDYYTGGVSIAKVDARPGYAALSAVRQHHVYPFNDDLASRPGPRIVDGLEALARLLHPELFR